MCSRQARATASQLVLPAAMDCAISVAVRRLREAEEVFAAAAFMASSLGLDAGGLYDRGPTLDLRRDGFPELFGCAGDDVHACPGVTRLRIGLLENADHLARELVHDRLRRAFRREDALPVAHLQVGDAGLDHGGNVWQLR